MDEVEIPDLVCWWCKGAVNSNRMYPGVEDALDLHKVMFNGTQYGFSDGESRIVCHRCLDLFYSWCMKFRREFISLAA